ncbi:MAG: hypothetical protein ACN4GF_03715 [Lentimonas sp.]
MHAQAPAFESEFFPELDAHSDELIRLKGLAELYPGTILFEEPKLAIRSQREEAASIEELPREITYVRIYRLEEAITALKEVVNHPALILDMRYLQSDRSGIALANLLNRENNTATLTAVGQITIEVKGTAKDPEDASSQRSYPAIVLCNRETAGPFEAILHSLQSQGCILAVGEATSGRTGYYQASDHGAWIIEGEVRPTPELSILETGFVPRIEIDATPESNYISYYLYEAGTSITRLLRDDTKQSVTPKDDEAKTNKETAETFEPDAVLQRGVDIVAALQVLQQLPENK